MTHHELNILFVYVKINFFSRTAEILFDLLQEKKGNMKENIPMWVLQCL